MSTNEPIDVNDATAGERLRAVFMQFISVTKVKVAGFTLGERVQVRWFAMFKRLLAGVALVFAAAFAGIPTSLNRVGDRVFSGVIGFAEKFLTLYFIGPLNVFSGAANTSEAAVSELGIAAAPVGVAVVVATYYGYTFVTGVIGGIIDG